MGTWFSRLYDRVLHWAGHRHAERYLVGLTVSEAIFFPIPPDVMLAPMVLAQRHRAWALATITTIASVMGGFIGYCVGLWAIDVVLPLIERGGYLHAYEQAVSAFERYGVWFVILAGFSPIPFKLITVAAGVLGMPLIPFVLGSIVGRGARFFMVCGIIYAGGERAAERLRAWVDRLGWAAVILALLAALFWLTGCAQPAIAPVSHRSGLVVSSQAVAPATYRVQSGDSLYSIAFRYRLDWRDVARWNQIGSPYVIQAGDLLKLRAPVGPSSQRQVRARPQPSTNETLPIRPATIETPKALTSPRGEAESISGRVLSAPTSADAPTRRVEGVTWQWPLAGPLVKPFNPAATRRGISIGGQEGSTVVAAADGQVVYSGTALIGYGELIIIKHSETFLSAYGYNDKRLVEEGAHVEGGAPIAEVGQNTEGQWVLHFEVRRNGEALDPRAVLPTLNQ